ncbi:sortase [candidate division WWE3 bacterium]|nr:sortase [candidate division WWE3 bacterium]
MNKLYIGFGFVFALMLAVVLFMATRPSQAAPKAALETIAPTAMAAVSSPTAAPMATAEPEQTFSVMSMPQTKSAPMLRSTQVLTIPVRVVVTRGTETLVDTEIVPGGVSQVTVPGSDTPQFVPETDRLKASWLQYFCGVGEDCRIYLSAHRWGWRSEQNTPAFGRLCDVQAGDIATLYTADGIGHQYNVVLKLELDANDSAMSAFLKADTKGQGSVLTMTTCSGDREQVNNTTVAEKRCVVIGKPIN